MERKLASIQRIAEIKTIKDADRICAYRVGGWWVVDAKNKYCVGDSVVYFEIDSWMPTSIAPFLSKGKEPREFNGVKGERLRTVKLRGQISQGLIMPTCEVMCGMVYQDKEGIDCTDALAIQKWEAPGKHSTSRNY